MANRKGAGVKMAYNMAELVDKYENVLNIYEYCDYYYKKYSNPATEARRRKRKPIWSDIYKNTKTQQI